MYTFEYRNIFLSRSPIQLSLWTFGPNFLRDQIGYLFYPMTGVDNCTNANQEWVTATQVAREWKFISLSKMIKGNGICKIKVNSCTSLAIPVKQNSDLQLLNHSSWDYFSWILIFDAVSIKWAPKFSECGRAKGPRMVLTDFDIESIWTIVGSRRLSDILARPTLVTLFVPFRHVIYLSFKHYLPRTAAYNDVGVL